MYVKRDLHKCYRLENLIGKGLSGDVFLAFHKETEKKRAIKKIPKKKSRKKPNELSSYLTEIGVLVASDHPNILKLFEVFEDERSHYLVTEWYSGGELFDYIM